MTLPRRSRPLLAAVAVAAVAGVTLVARPAQSPAAKMAEAASKFLTALPPDLKKKATYPFDSDERTRWNFVPLQDRDKRPTRKGVRFEELTDAQKTDALELLRAGLGIKGFEQATAIMSLETILADLEKNGQNVRNPNWYFVTVFGDPSSTGKWGWRVEGHHLSVNFTLDRGQVESPTPLFFGANPAEIMSGPRKGFRTLPGVDDYAKELIAALDADQQKVARQPKEFPEVVANTKAPVGTPVGLPAGKMTAAQKAVLWKLLEEYANRLPPDLAAAELKRVRDAGVDRVHFAYCVEDQKPGKPHTYRVQGPTFVIEFLDIQADSANNPANHIHSVWRRLPADFGLDGK